MKVILLKNVPNLGSAGDIRDVAPVFARNVLLKQQLAKLATEENIQKIKTQHEQQTKHAHKQRAEKEKLANVINGATVTFTEKTSETGTLFAGIDEKKIAKKLSDTYKLSVKPSHIILKEHIKHTGTFPVKYKAADKELTFTVNVKAA